MHINVAIQLLNVTEIYTAIWEKIQYIYIYIIIQRL